MSGFVSGRVGLVASLLALAPTTFPMPVASQVQISSEERFFRIEWEVVRVDGRPPAIVGSVTNHYSYPIQRVQLEARVLDETGQMTDETLGTIGDIPPGGRGFFRLQLRGSGARYVITVHAFEFGATQSP